MSKWSRGVSNTKMLLDGLGISGKRTFQFVDLTGCKCVMKIVVCIDGCAV